MKQVDKSRKNQAPAFGGFSTSEIFPDRTGGNHSGYSNQGVSAIKNFKIIIKYFNNINIFYMGLNIRFFYISSFKYVF